MVGDRTYFFLICTLLFLNGTLCNRRYKKSKIQIPKNELYLLDKLPSDRQVTVFLNKGQPKIYWYLSPLENTHLSVTITACSSVVKWSVKFEKNYNENNSEYEQITNNIVTKSLISHKGMYILKLLSENSDTYVNIYVSTEPGGPAALQKASLQKLELFKRQRKRKITVKWKTSLIDPQWTLHCLIISTKKLYKSLCSAEFDRNFKYRSLMNLNSDSQTIISFQNKEERIPQNIDNDPIIACVGKKTQYTVSNLKQGQTYFFSLFAINIHSNLTYPFGSTYTQFDSKIPPVSLRDAKSTSVSLKKYDGKVVFRYKVSRKAGKTLNIFVFPCGTTVFAEVLLKNKKIIPRRKIYKSDKIVVPLPLKGARYYIKISTNNDEYLKRQSGVEVGYKSLPRGNKINIKVICGMSPNKLNFCREHWKQNLASSASDGLGIYYKTYLKLKNLCLRDLNLHLGKLIYLQSSYGFHKDCSISFSQTYFQIFATSKQYAEPPLPNMPLETSVKEYESLRQCHSVTIGWIPSENKFLEYCFVIREGRLQESEDYENVNQCGLENRLKKSVDYVLQYCKEFSYNASVLTEKISNLKSGKYYIIQVTVKKPKGRSLSYDLVEANTLPFCDTRR